MRNPEHFLDGTDQNRPLLPNDSLIRIWLTVALRPTPRIFAEVAQITSRRWVIISLAVAGMLSLVSNSVNWLKVNLLPAQFSPIGFSLFGIPVTGAPTIFAIVALPLLSIVGALATAFAVAMVMPPTSGMTRIRWEHVLNPMCEFL